MDLRKNQKRNNTIKIINLKQTSKPKSPLIEDKNQCIYYMDPAIKAEADQKKKDEEEAQKNLHKIPSVFENLKSF